MFPSSYFLKSLNSCLPTEPSSLKKNCFRTSLLNVINYTETVLRFCRRRNFFGADHFFLKFREVPPPFFFAKRNFLWVLINVLTFFIK
ncbi:MAG: hypothetical protein A2007_05910 [Verrucomicrobia bacterium GWC2_42_7]|nr:MAG: hypothetical protein A2007_05910 [Verrucomicrobia bacterium GWC2_42_7]